MENEMPKPMQVEDVVAGLGSHSSLADVMLVLFSRHVTNDISNAIAALKSCRCHARGPGAPDILDTAIARLGEAERVRHLLCDPPDGPVFLPERICDLAVAIKRSQENAGPTQLSFHLEPIEVEGKICRCILTAIAEAVFDALRYDYMKKGGTISLNLSRKDWTLEIDVQSDGLGGWHALQPTGSPVSTAGLIKTMITSLGGNVARWSSSTGTRVNITLPVTEIPARAPQYYPNSTCVNSIQEGRRFTTRHEYERISRADVSASLN
jgi:hypothetical protein